MSWACSILCVTANARIYKMCMNVYAKRMEGRGSSDTRHCAIQLIGVRSQWKYVRVVANEMVVHYDYFIYNILHCNWSAKCVNITVVIANMLLLLLLLSTVQTNIQMNQIVFVDPYNNERIIKHIIEHLWALVPRWSSCVHTHIFSGESMHACMHAQINLLHQSLIFMLGIASRWMHSSTRQSTPILVTFWCTYWQHTH